MIDQTGDKVDKNIAEKIKSLQKRNSELRKIWREIKNFRNNLAHCGVGGAEKEDLSGLKKKIKDLTDRLEDEIRKG